MLAELQIKGNIYYKLIMKPTFKRRLKPLEVFYIDLVGFNNFTPN